MPSKQKLPPLQVFHDVDIIACEQPGSGNGGYGPIWPNWDEQTIARHCRGNRPFDKKPEPPTPPLAIIEEPIIWGGFLHRHFGHFVSEIASRILQSRRDGSTDKFIYAADYGAVRAHGWSRVPGHFLPVVNWLGVEKENITLLKSHMKARHIEVAAQAEQLGRTGVGPEYLDLLDENSARNKLVPKPAKHVYVSRAQLAPKLGGHAGDLYLVEALAKLGVEIFYPENHPIPEQMAVYTGAEHLIISQGSAIHGLQLLGRQMKSISILNRTPNSILGVDNLRPRCENLQYINAIQHFFVYTGRKDVPIPNLGKMVFDLDILFHSFKQMGLDLASVWNMDDYQKSVNKSLKQWVDGFVAELQRHGYHNSQTDLLKQFVDADYLEIAHFTEKRLSEKPS